MLFNAAILLSVLLAFPGVQATSQTATPCELFNVGSNATAFTFDRKANETDLDVLLSTDVMPNEEWSMWNVPQSHHWLFVNGGTGQWLTVEREDNHLISSNNGPTQFAINATDGQLVIGLPDETDKAFEAVYDGTSGKYGKIVLLPADETSLYQRWICM